MPVTKIQPSGVNNSATFTFANVNVTSNIAAGNANLGNLATANFVSGTLTSSAQPNITSVGTLTSLNVSGNITPSANVTYDIGNATHRFKDLYLSNSTIYLGNTTFSESDVLPFNLTIAPEVLVINVDAPFAGNDIHWLFTWAQSTLPYARTSITNQMQTSVPLYKQGTYQVNNFANEIHGNMDQRHDLYLKWIDGAGTDNLVSWAVSNGNVTFSHPDINGGANTTVQRTTITVPSTITLPTLNLPSNVTYNVAATTSNVFTFTGSGVGDNRTLGPLYRGATYTFNLDSSLGDDNKFYITTDNGTGFVANTYVGEYTSGVTGSRGNGAVGYNTLSFTVPNNAPDFLYYQSANVANRHGPIIIKDLAVETNINGNPILYFQHGREGHKTPVEIRPIPSMVNQMCLVYDATVGQFVPQDLATYIENTPSFKNKIQEVAGTATLIAPDGLVVVPSVLIVEDVSYLPIFDNNDGDIAFDQYTNTLYVWDTNAWKSTKPTSVATVTANAQPNITSVGTLTSLTVSGNITPSANVTYNLGNATHRFKDLFLSGNTIDLAGATIKTDETSGAIALIPQPTVSSPNPNALIISPSGGIVTATTSAGEITASAISNASANSAAAQTFGVITMMQAGNVPNTFTGTSRYYPTSNISIVNVFASLGTASSANLGFTIKKNGNNVGNFTVTANSYRLTGTSANISVTTSDYLTLDITSGSGATDLKVDLQYKLQ